MSTETPKPKKRVSKIPATEPAIVKTRNKNISKKSVIAKVGEPAEYKKPVKADESQVTTYTTKRKNEKVKVIRDSFSFPEQDYVKISELKKTCLAAGVHVKKGELLRAGLHLLSKLSLTELKHVVEAVEKVQTGRPKS